MSRQFYPTIWHRKVSWMPVQCQNETPWILQEGIVAVFPSFGRIRAWEGRFLGPLLLVILLKPVCLSLYISLSFLFVSPSISLGFVAALLQEGDT